MSHSKVIPEYAKDFEKEWLCIRGINKECEKFIERTNSISEGKFNSPQANRIKKYIKSIFESSRTWTT